jgi:capsule polysaccharide modification protein KpsS
MTNCEGKTTLISNGTKSKPLVKTFTKAIWARDVHDNNEIKLAPRRSYVVWTVIKKTKEGVTINSPRGLSRIIPNKTTVYVGA